MNFQFRRGTTAVWAAILFALLSAAPVEAQITPPVGLSLQNAISRAVNNSEEVGLAEAQVNMANAQVKEAYSTLFPQINGSAGYTRTIKSSFSTGGGGALPDSMKFSPDPNAPLEERVRYLEDNAQKAAIGAIGALFSNLPFGQKNTYAYGLNGSQVLFAPQAGAAVSIAKHFKQAAEYNFTEEQANIRLQVEQAYIQSLLAGELVSISEAALTQAEAFLSEEQLRKRAGRASDLEVLRAEVDLENLRPQLVQAQNAQEVSMLNLKRLTNIPYEQPITLTTPLTLPEPEALANVELDADAVLSSRAAIRAAAEQVRLREAQVRLEKAAFLPRLAATGTYGRQLFANDVFNFGGNWRTDFSVGIGLQIPIFSGFQRVAAVQQARVELNRAEYQLAQLREAVGLQLEQALGEKRRARTLIEARQRTVDQADRVYRLTTLQYEQGVTTQLEVSNARLALLSARSNLVQALADFYLADADLVRAQVTPAMSNARVQMPSGTMPQPVMPDGMTPPGNAMPDPTDPVPNAVPGGSR